MCVSVAGAGGITNVDRGRMEEVLDLVAKDVQKNFYDSKLKGLDWKALTERSRERIRKAENRRNDRGYIRIGVSTQ